MPRKQLNRKDAKNAAKKAHAGAIPRGNGFPVTVYFDESGFLDLAYITARTGLSRSEVVARLFEFMLNTTSAESLATSLGARS